MSQAIRQAASVPATEYEADFYLWCYEQAEALRQRRFAVVDLPNIIEELESMGRSDRRALRSSYRLVILHLLKWQFQPERLTTSWQTTLNRQREQIEELEAESPSLASQTRQIIAEAYPAARRAAADETGMPISTFPAECPFGADALRDLDRLP